MHKFYNKYLKSFFLKKKKQNHFILITDSHIRSSAMVFFWSVALRKRGAKMHFERVRLKYREPPLSGN